MPKASKFSPDEGLTIYDLKDSEAVHYGEQSKGYVGKNLIKYGKDVYTRTIFGITYTVNSDGTITANGTATADAILILCNMNIGNINMNSVDATTANGYILTDGLDVHSVSTFVVRYNAADHNIYINTKNGTVANNVVYKPMLRLDTISDDTYEPYAPNNREILEKMSYADNRILGAKNFWFWRIASQERSGITYTQNDDGTVGINGTATAQADLYSEKFKFKNKGQYIITGCPSGGGIESATNYGIGIYDYSAEKWFWDYGFGVRFEVTDTDTEYMFSYVVRNGKTVSNLVLKPMLRLASDTDDTYTSYAMTNEELTRRMSGIYSKIITIPRNSSVRITASQEYQQFFAFAQRNMAFMFWNDVSSASLVPVNSGSSSMPTVSFVSNKVTDLNNSITDASIRICIMSYADFAVT